MVYSHGDRNYLYWLAVVNDVILRFIWIAAHFMSTKLAQFKTIWSTFFGLFEIFRRYIWNFLRLENEHLNNCGAFRAVRDISIVALK